MSGTRRLLAAALLAALSGCGPQRIAGGGSSESGNAIVAGRVVDSGGAALAGARLYLVEDSAWMERALAGEPVVVDSARADSQGRFELRVPLDRSLNLQVDGEGQGLLLRAVTGTLDSGRNDRVYTAGPYGRAGGGLEAAGGVAREVRLTGTTYRAELLPGDRYRFPGLPGGRYPTLVHQAWEGGGLATPSASLRILPGVDLEARLAVAADRFVLEDFSAPWPRPKLRDFTGLGSWYEVRDDTPPARQNSRLVRSLVDGPDSHEGPALQVQVVLDSAYAGVGLHFGRVESTYDLSALEAVSFMARGRGRVTISVESPLLATAEDDQFEYVVELPAAWSRVTVPVDSLRLPAGSEPARQGVTWSQVAGSIARLEFLVRREHTAPGDTTELRMDDLTLEGVPFRVFVP